MNTDPSNCFHLSVDNAFEIHKNVIRDFGGSDGIRSRELLESAIAAPQATFGGVSTYSDVIEIAAAYLFGLCSNHPFIDGNKRVALGACIVFLKVNGYSPTPDGDDWELLTLDVASGKLTREETAVRLRELVSDS